MKFKITILSILILTGPISFSQNWHRTIENLDKNGKRHGYFEVQDTLSNVYGFGLMISKFELGKISNLVLDGPAMNNKQIKVNDIIKGFEIGNKYLSFEELGYEKAFELMRYSDTLVFIIISTGRDIEIKTELTKSYHLLRISDKDGLKIIGNFKHGKMHGVWRTFDFKGSLINTRIFKNDKEVKCEGDCSYPPYADYL